MVCASFSLAGTRVFFFTVVPVSSKVSNASGPRAGGKASVNWAGLRVFADRKDGTTKVVWAYSALGLRVNASRPGTPPPWECEIS